MLERKVNAVVLRSVNYRESDRILTLLSPDCGKLTAAARGCRRLKSPLLSCSQPFCYAEFVLAPLMGKWTVRQCALKESFYDLRLHYPRLTAAAAALREAEAAAPEDQPAKQLFLLVYCALSFWAYAENPATDLLLCFLLKLLALSGYLPATTRCGVCGQSTYKNARFDADLGALCASCGALRGGIPTAPLTLEAMRRMIALPEQDMKKVALPGAVRRELLAVLPGYYLHHTGRGKELNGLLEGLANMEARPE